MIKGTKHTLKAKRKLSRAMERRREKFGYILSPETIEKIVKHARGKPLSKKRRKNISKGLMGRKLSKKHKEDISKSLIGSKLSKDHRKNIGKSLIGNKRALGHIHFTSERTKKKLRKSAIEGIKAGRRYPYQSKVCVYKGAILHSSYELRFVKVCEKLGIKWKKAKRWFEYKFNGGSHYYLPDFWLPKIKCYIEIKGWMHPKTKEKLQSVRDNGKKIYLIMLDDLRIFEKCSSLKSIRSLIK